MNVPNAVLESLQDFQAWKAGKPDFDLLDYAGCVATPDLFFALSAVLAPELVVHEGNYFFASHFERSTYEAWKEKRRDPIAIQKVMNHLHLSTLFQAQDIPPAVVKTIAGRLASIWSLVFADKGLVGEASGNSLEDAEVTLFRGTRR